MRIRKQRHAIIWGGTDSAMSIEDREWYRQDYQRREQKQRNDPGPFKDHRKDMHDAPDGTERYRSREDIPHETMKIVVSSTVSKEGEDYNIPVSCIQCGTPFHVKMKRGASIQKTYECPCCGHPVTVSKESLTGKGLFIMMILLTLCLSYVAVYGVENFNFPVIVPVAMLLINLISIILVFKKTVPKSGIRTATFVSFLISEWYLGLYLYPYLIQFLTARQWKLF